ncbi:MAG: MucR family transcriptional regulator [Desulfovibrionaceae bacterium]|nr:MucR family transcriptional regulator [Desulfovibrionaceae bacterium]MBF0514172.1 MucR family transcriptional regulator [Desulfovibrionaceae bacterium]
MDDYLKEALEIVKAQAAHRAMAEDEITSMVAGLAAKLRCLSGAGEAAQVEAGLGLDPKKAFKEKSVSCLECGKAFKIITKKHLATHELDLKSYLEKHGLKKGTKLIAKELQRNRRKKMTDMKLWEKRKKNDAPKAKKGA